MVDQLDFIGLLQDNYNTFCLIIDIILMSPTDKRFERRLSTSIVSYTISDKPTDLSLHMLTCFKIAFGCWDLCSQI